jgi:two-component system LytT family sensor kinase
MTLPLVLVWGTAIGYVLLVTAVGARLRGGAPPAPQLVEQIVLLVLWAAGTPPILWSARRFPLDRDRIRRVAVHLALAGGFILAINLLAPLVRMILLGETLHLGAAWRYGSVAFVQMYHLALIVYAFILGIGHYLQMLESRRTEELRAERLRTSLVEAQLRALQLQLEPHMLFNALNAVGALVLTDRKSEAFDVIGRLGDLLRAVLAAETRQEVSLREEIDLTRAYLSIEQARLGDRLDVRWEIAPDAEVARIPPLLLQPLVENAVRHGVARRVEGGHLVVRAQRVGERLRLEVRDDGPGAEATGAAPGTGIGLENARQRLKQLYGTEQRLTLERTGDWTRAVLELPFRRYLERIEAA